MSKIIRPRLSMPALASRELVLPPRFSRGRKPGKFAKSWLELVKLSSLGMMASETECCQGTRCFKCLFPGPYVERKDSNGIWAAMSVAVGAYGFFDCEDVQCSTCLGATVLYGGIQSGSNPGVWCDDWGPYTSNPGGSEDCGVSLWADNSGVHPELCAWGCDTGNDGNGLTADFSISDFVQFGWFYLSFTCTVICGTTHVTTDPIEIPFVPCN